MTCYHFCVQKLALDKLLYIVQLHYNTGLKYIK